PAPTGTPTPFARPAATPTSTLASSVLVLQWPGTQGRRELRPVDPATGGDVPGYPPITVGEDTMFGPPYTFSADGTKLAAVAAKGNNCESVGGGTACRARRCAPLDRPARLARGDGGAPRARLGLAARLQPRRGAPRAGLPRAGLQRAPALRRRHRAAPHPAGARLPPLARRVHRGRGGAGGLRRATRRGPG